MMNRSLALALVTLAFAGCGSPSASSPPAGKAGGAGTGGMSAGPQPTATGGSVGTGGAPVSPPSGSGGEVGTTPADAAATGGSVGGETTPDAAPAPTTKDGGAPVSTTDAASGPGPGGPPLTGDMIGWYECEADANQFIAPARVTVCMAGPCPPMTPIKEGLECCSGGKKVSNVERGNGQLQINKISVPADGMYDVTWWYHCGKNDNFRDPGCAGDPMRTASGCRPHILVVNGTRMKTFEFRCFPGSWGELHAATTPVPLKAGGDNNIRVFATPGNDAADLDAIAIYPPGKGIGPVPFSH